MKYIKHIWCFLHGGHNWYYFYSVGGYNYAAFRCKRCKLGVFASGRASKEYKDAIDAPKSRGFEMHEELSDKEMAKITGWDEPF